MNKDILIGILLFSYAVGFIAFFNMISSAGQNAIIFLFVWLINTVIVVAALFYLMAEPDRAGG